MACLAKSDQALPNRVFVLQRRHLLSTAWASIRAATGARRSLLATTSETLMFEFTESVTGFSASSIDVTNGEVGASCIALVLCTEQVFPTPSVAYCGCTPGSSQA